LQALILSVSGHFVFCDLFCADLLLSNYTYPLTYTLFSTSQSFWLFVLWASRWLLYIGVAMCGRTGDVT